LYLRAGISKIIHRDSLRSENLIYKLYQSNTTLESRRFKIMPGDNIRSESPNRDSCQSEIAFIRNARDPRSISGKLVRGP